jgi:hypothetical protein
MSRTEPCGDESGPTPAFDEIISIVAPVLRGSFDGPVDTPEPRLVPLRLERSGGQTQPGYWIEVDASGRGMITVAGGRPQQRELEFQQRDTLRLLIARIIEKPVVPCTPSGHYQLRVEKQPAVIGPECGFPERQREFHAVTVLLEEAFNA